MSSKKADKQDRGPKLHEPVCIGEEVKIGIHLAIEKFRLDSSRQELSFPSSLSATERAYIHRFCSELNNLKARSRGNGPNRFMCVRKVGGGSQGSSAPSLFSLAHSSAQISTVLSKYPVTAKEKQDLTPATAKGAVRKEGWDKSNFGRLTHVVPQVPLKRCPSELTKFREALPVYQMGADILKVIKSNQVALVAGETGSGKTTQVPQLILDDCHDRSVPCQILCTQPRRIAAISIAERVAAERGERLGHVVGYQIRLDSRMSQKTALTFCTTGVLLRTLMGGDACLDGVTHVIVDEVHERDRFTDFLLLCLKEALPRHSKLRVVLMSATLNMELFSEYFNQCPVVCVPGSLFPVKESFLEDVLKWTGFSTKAMDQAILKTQKFKTQEECLADWCNKQLNIADSAVGSGTEEDSDFTTSDNAELGEEREDLEPWLVEEMDRLLREVWLTGSEELFHQVLYLISSENVSVDYVQSETSTTPLMIAAARGFTRIVEHLLILGADAEFKTSNHLTALDFARKFERTNIVELLEAHIASLHSANTEVNDDDLVISEEDKELLSVYQHCFDDDKVDVPLVTCLIFKIHETEQDGAILVFLPGYDDIMSLKGAITEDSRFLPGQFVIYTLHSSLQYSDQKKIFQPTPSGIRKIILSTNIAETSITINDVVFVIDCGKVKEKTYDALTSLTMLKSNWISKASALQRKGRAGRCQSGKCYHLFSRSRYMHLQDYQTPEILRLPLQELCLHTKLLASHSQSIESFLGKCPQAPPCLIIRNAVENLKQIDALDPFEDLTELGHHLADLPVEPRLGKVILYSVVLKCLDPVLTIVSTLSHKEPFIIPALPSERRSVMVKKRKFAEETYSDHMVYLRAYQTWQKAKAEGWERTFCEKNFVASSAMEMISGIRGQLLAQLRASGFLKPRGAGDLRDLNTNSDNWALVKACLLAGTYPNVMQRGSNGSLCTFCEKRVKFHTSSILQPVTGVSSMLPNASMKKFVKTLPSKWLIYEEMSRSQRVSLAKCCTLVSPTAMFLAGGHSKVTTDVIKTADVREPDLEGDKHQADVDDDDEDKETEDGNVVVKVDNWISFGFDSLANAKSAVQFRMKWHSLFLSRMRHPTRMWTQSEEAVLQAVCTVLTNAEKAIGLENPVAVGQRPRIIEPCNETGFDDGYSQSGGAGGYQRQYYHHHQQQQQQHYPQHNRQHQQFFQLHPHQPQQFQHPHHHHHQQFQQHQHPHQQQFQQHQHPHQHQHTTRGHNGGNDPGQVTHQQQHQRKSAPTNSVKDNPSLSKATESATGGGETHNSGSDSTGRYFLMKCYNQKIVDVSEAKGIWATSAANQAKLNKAFQGGKNVYLIFCVPGNATFQGYAKMTSGITKNKSPDFPSPGLTGVFNVQWIKRALLPFSMTHTLLNPWNENRKVHSGRDGQEIEGKVALELLKLWDTHQLRQPQSRVQKPATGKQAQKTVQGKSQNPPHKEPSAANSSCNNEEESLKSLSSSSPSLSTHTNSVSNDSASRPGSASSNSPVVSNASSQFQENFDRGQLGQVSVGQTQLMSQTACGPTGVTYYQSCYQPEGLGHQVLNLASPSGRSSIPLMPTGQLSAGMPVGPHSGLSPVMILHRCHPGTVPQAQHSQYFTGQFNQHK